MTTFLIRRLAFGIVLVFLSSILSFAILKASPNSATAGDYDPRLSKEYRDQQRRLLGLDRHPVKQYLDWLGVSRLLNSKEEFSGLLQGSLGMSSQYKQPVATLIGSRLSATLTLNLISLAVTWLVAIPLGIYAAVHQYKWPDKVLSGISFMGMSMPGFFLALVILWLFASRWPILPPGGLRDLDHDKMSATGQALDFASHLIIPVVVLAVGALAELQRICRGNMLETLRMQYVTTARAKGLSESKVVYKHALRNAVNPLVTLLGFDFAALFGGAALMEIVINYPGMGVLLLEGLRSNDQWLVMSLFLIGSGMLVLGNLVAELLLALVDPRVTYA